METKDDSDRINYLNFAINSEYANRSIDFVDSMADFYGESIMEMFEIEKVGKNFVALAHHFEELIYEPVVFPDEIKNLLKPDDLFLMRLAKYEGQWLVLWMSPAYESFDWREGAETLN